MGIHYWLYQWWQWGPHYILSTSLSTGKAPRALFPFMSYTDSLCLLLLILCKVHMCNHIPSLPTSIFFMSPTHLPFNFISYLSFKNKSMSEVSSTDIHLGGEAIPVAWVTYQWPYPKEKWLSLLLKSSYFNSSSFSCGTSVVSPLSML